MNNQKKELTNHMQGLEELANSKTDNEITTFCYQHPWTTKQLKDLMFNDFAEEVAEITINELEEAGKNITRKVRYDAINETYNALLSISIMNSSCNFQGNARDYKFFKIDDQISPNYEIHIFKSDNNKQLNYQTSINLGEAKEVPGLFSEQVAKLSKVLFPKK
ncbi:hypothetical protein JXA48_03465 [Candidatus Woesearchaeota archaeon]|nr:hypothetical protein [Candidatus Woesearchaeota archaeon]